MRLLRWAAAGLGGLALITVLVAIVARFSDGPVAVFPGGALEAGPLHTGAEPDWSFARDVPEIELELVGPGISRTVWLMIHEGKPYVVSGYMGSTLGQLWKQWPAQALADGRAVVRVEGTRYERRLVRIVDDRPLLEAIAAEVLRKYGAPLTADMADTGDAWYFALEPPDRSGRR